MVTPLIGIPCANHPVNGELGSLQEPSETPTFRVQRSYVEAIARAGGAAVLLPVGRSIEVLGSIAGRLQGLLLAGGVDMDPERYGAERHPALGKVDRERDETELWLTQWAIEHDVPGLAICRGWQVLNVAAGGTLYQDLGSECAGALKHDLYFPAHRLNELAHWIDVAPDTVLRAIIGARDLQVNSRHHQAARTLGADLRVTVRATDGMIEGIEMRGRRFIVGVQWHPENLIDEAPAMFRLFHAFIEEASCVESR